MVTTPDVRESDFPRERLELGVGEVVGHHPVAMRIQQRLLGGGESERHRILPRGARAFRFTPI